MPRSIEQALLNKAAEMMDEEFSPHTARLLANITMSDELLSQAQKAQTMLSALNELAAMGEKSKEI